jgi:hypothetical protein
MRLGLIMFLTIPLLGQRSRPAVSPPPVPVEGTVQDESGNQIQGARVDHAPFTRNGFGPETDSQGHFTVQADGPAVVIRKPGFDSYFLRTDGTNPVHVIMKSFKPWPECVFAAAILPKVKVVTGGDVDYTTTSRILETKEGPKALQDGKGPLWTVGMPNTSEVWSSVEYVEHIEVVNGPLWVIDARGKTKEGKYWRYRGMLGQSSAYGNVDQPTAALMDRLIGGHCPPF